MRFPEVYTFVIEASPKQQALKVLEEAGEVVDAVKHGNRREIQDEIMDVVQALANLCERLDYDEFDLGVAYRRVFERNKERGRYERCF